MSKQKGCTISTKDLESYLKWKYKCPEDTELCTVDRIPCSSMISIVIHSDEFSECDHYTEFPYQQLSVKLVREWLKS